MEIADTGDILFFKSKSLSGKFTRFITRAGYDHVAVILKFKNNSIHLFEATGNYVFINISIFI